VVIYLLLYRIFRNIEPGRNPGLVPRRARSNPGACGFCPTGRMCADSGRSFVTCSLMTLPSARPAALAWTALMT